MDYWADSLRSQHDLRPAAAGTRRSVSGLGKADSPITGMAGSNDRVGALLMEANEISRFLNKEYVFRKGDGSLTDDTVNFVKVINSKQNVSCQWPLSKLREKLQSLRRLVYVESSDSTNSTKAEEILFDGTDTWLPETDTASPPLPDVPTVPRCTTVSPAASKSVWQSSRNSSSPRSTASSFNSSGKKSHVVSLESRSTGHHSMQPVRLASPATEFVNTNGSSNSHQVSEAGELTADTQFVPTLSPRRTSPPSSLTSSLQQSFLAVEYYDSANFPSTVDSGVPARSPRCSPQIKEPLRIERSLRHSMAKPSLSFLQQQQLKPAWNLSPSPNCTSCTQMDARCETLLPAASNVPVITSTAACTQTDDGAELRLYQSLATQTVNEELAQTCQSPPGDDRTIAKLCKDVTALMLTRLSVSGSNASCTEVIDRIMRLCQSIRRGVSIVLQVNFPTAESTNPQSGEVGCKFEVVCLQVVLATELLVSSIEFWCSQQLSTHASSTALYDSRRNLMQMVKELTKDCVIFWQACENKVEVLVRDTATKILSLLLELVTESGKMAVVAGVCPVSLPDSKRTSLEQLLLQRSARTDDLLSLEPGIEVKQAFLSGCDIMVDETVQDCLQALEDNEGILQTSAEHCKATANSTVKEEVLKCVFVVLTRCKMLLVQLQQIQVDLDSEIKDKTEKPPNYFYHYFERCIAVMSGAHKVTDSITLLTRTVEPFHTEIYSDMLRKICRCSEMVQRTTLRLSQTASSKNCLNTVASGQNIPSKRLSLDLSSFTSSSDDGSIHPTAAASNNGSVNWSATSLYDTFTLLSPTQSETLRQLIDAVGQATEELCLVIKLQLAQDEVIASASTSLAAETPIGQNIKRMLPVVPGSSVSGTGGGGVVMRCHSARSSDRRPSALSKHISLLNFPLKKSNEI